MSRYSSTKVLLVYDKKVTGMTTGYYGPITSYDDLILFITGFIMGDRGSFLIPESADGKYMEWITNVEMMVEDVGR